MDDASFVRGRQGGAQLPGDLDRAILGWAAEAAQRRREVFAVDIFHRQKEASVALADVVDATDVGM
jgi:hypothetical protein